MREIYYFNNKPRDDQRSLAVEQLEPRILYSAAPVPVDGGEAEAPAQEASAESAPAAAAPQVEAPVRKTRRVTTTFLPCPDGLGLVWIEFAIESP